jgi:hypothetical protein
MPRRKSKRATTYRQRPNALSALDIHTMMSYQRFQALCAISLVRNCRMLMLSMLFDDEGNDDDLLLLLYRHHISNLRNNLFFITLDSEFMTIEPDQVIPRFAPANRNRTFDLLEDGWCYHHTHFTVAQLRELYLCLQLPVTFTISTVGHKASSEEAFIITVTKLVTGRTNTSLMEVFGVVTDTFISRVYKKQLKYSTIRLMEFYTAIVCSIGYICSWSLWRLLRTSLIDLSMEDCCLKMLGLLAFWIAKLTKLALQALAL